MFNGERGYGMERGGVNIEHGSRNVIAWNYFSRNRCGVHLWWDEDAGLKKRPWVKSHERGSRDNVIAHNTFTEDEVALHLRRCTDTGVRENSHVRVKRELDADEGSAPRPLSHKVDRRPIPEPTVLGRTRPVSARVELRGRRNILMTKWGPWDRASPFLRLALGASQFAN